MRKLRRLSLGLFLFVLCYGLKLMAMESTPISGDLRKEPVRKVIIHATGGPDCDASRSFKSGTLAGIVVHFQQNQAKISVHYIVGRDGSIVSMVPEEQVAFHARGHNSNSIGIELVNDGDGKDVFSDDQVNALVGLLADILKRNKLGLQALRGHSEIDNDYLTCNGKKIKRKQDPGDAFPWGSVLNKLRLSMQPEIMPSIIQSGLQDERPTRSSSNTGSIFRAR